jgi:guanylate kinase
MTTAGPRTQGILFVLSAPSGTGKSSVARALLERVPDLEFSVSYTTRPRRPGEVDGREYHFVSRAAFEVRVREGAMLEWATVYQDLYGTGREPTVAALAAGCDLLLDIDVQGAQQVRAGTIPAVTVMLFPPDFAALEARLASRGTESRETIAERLERASEEAAQFASFDYIVINDRLERAVDEVASIVRAERRRTERCRNEAARILASFPSTKER